jgi:hypothetical protein
MKKLITLALVATLAIAGSAFASGRQYVAANNATFAFGAPASTNNDDSCDIGVAPAATLLLPYFRVDYTASRATARNTLFTITNTSFLPQIAHVVIWTDWSYPALDFNIFLTGYDVQSISMYDVLNGVIAPNAAGTGGGTSSDTTRPNNPGTDADPALNTANPNITDLTACSGTQLPGNIPTNLLTDLRLVLSTGQGTGAGIPCTSTVGGNHGAGTAVGYITIDVAPSCNTSLPNDGTYFANILFDNVLIGDYQDVNPDPTTGNYAGGNPLVHIRAVPEGGPAGSAPGTNLPYTFYSRYQVASGETLGIDRRQPLPSVFAARYIQGGAGQFNTNFKIWREGISEGTCDNASANSNLGATEIVRFDEHENANVGGGSLVISPLPPGAGIPETGSYPTTNSIFPGGPISGDVAGWMYLNLNVTGGSPLYNTTAPNGRPLPAAGAFGSRASQNWVIVSMAAEGRFSVDFDAAWLGNGCSGAVPAGTQIGPVGGVLVCPAGALGCTETGVYPNATYTANGRSTAGGTNATP